MPRTTSMDMTTRLDEALAIEQYRQQVRADAARMEQYAIQVEQAASSVLRAALRAAAIEDETRAGTPPARPGFLNARRRLDIEPVEPEADDVM